MKSPVSVSRLVLVASLFKHALSTPSPQNDRLRDRPYVVDQHHYPVRHGHARHHPPRLLDLPIHANGTEIPEPSMVYEEDGRYTWGAQNLPTNIGRTVKDGSMTMVAREKTPTNQTNTAPTTTATEVEEAIIYVNENAQTISTETNIIPIISQATLFSSPTSSSASSTSASSPAKTTLHQKTKRTNLSSYLSYNKAYKKLVVKPKPKTTTPSTTNNNTILINTTTHIHPGFSPQRLPGVTYAPYDLSGCRSPSNIASDFRKISKTGLYSSVRIYGVDCSQVLHTLRAASAVTPPLKLFLGIFHLSDLTSQITTLVRDVQTFAATSSPKKTVEEIWETMVDTISVGNELVNNGQATPAQVLAAVRRVREALRREGYRGPVVTVDTFVAVLKHPQLCASPDTDYCAVNVHPFFDPHTDATKAANFVKRQVLNIREATTPRVNRGKAPNTAGEVKGGGQTTSKGENAGNGANGAKGAKGAKGTGEQNEGKEIKEEPRQKRVVVTETGWPTQGNANNEAVPGRTEQKKVVEGVMKIWQEAKERQFGDDGDFEVYMFTAFDDPWKVAARETFYAEQFWGIHNA